jgi:hypothetical protein
MMSMDEKLEAKTNKKLAARERQRKLYIDDFVKAGLSTPQGRAYMYWLLEVSKTNYQPFTGNALTTSFNCGEMNIGKQVLAHIIEVAPDDYLKMLKERREEEINDRQYDSEPEPE